MTHEVVITGAGTINPLGANVSDTLNAMQSGQCAIGPLEMPDLDRLAVKIGAQVKDFEAEAHFSRQELTLYDRFTQFALVAADEAMAQAGLSGEQMRDVRAGVVMGTAGGGVGTWNEAYRSVFHDGKSRVHPFTVPRLMNNAAASHISMKYNVLGPSFSVSTACASSNHAMAQALMLIRSGQADLVLTGGSESMLSFGGIKAWEGLRVMSKTGCRPFSVDRDGMVQGEGAAVFVFERADHARARGAVALANVAGASMCSDAADIVLPSQEGAERAMAEALRQADLSPADIGYVNAHGTGTMANDRTESAAILATFDGRSPAISSTKSMHGHLIGGTGAVELLACLSALRDGQIPPTVNHAADDPDCAVDLVKNVARTSSVQATLSNAFAFGGLNAVVALKRA